ncbi:hypothetical protein ACKFKF_18505 [Phormidesmis sp. 146-12]
MKSIYLALLTGSIAIFSCSAPTPATLPTPKPAAPRSPDSTPDEAIVKQTVMDAYNRKPLSEQALRLHDITMANDYAIVEGAVGDAIVQFLVRRQQGKWQVVAMELGEPFGEQAGLLAQKVPAATVQKLLSFQKLREVAAIAKREKSSEPSPFWDEFSPLAHCMGRFIVTIAAPQIRLGYSF